MLLTIITPTYRRPLRLIRCLESVRQQTLVHTIQHLVLPDHVGVGIAGMFASLPTVAPAVLGQYVYVLADDDVLADATVVEDFKAQVGAAPPVLVCMARKDGSTWPVCDVERVGPIVGQIDLGCLLVRRDVWVANCHAYGKRYEGDFDFARHLWELGIPFTYWPRLVSCGDVLRGRSEYDDRVPPPGAL